MQRTLQRLIDLSGYPTLTFVAALNPQEPEQVRRLRLKPALADGAADDGRIATQCAALTEALDTAALQAAHGVVAVAAPDQPAQVVPLPHTPALEGTWVCRTPRVRDLLRALDYTHHHRILVVAEQDSRLFDGDGSGNLVEHFGHGFPLTHVGPTGRGAVAPHFRRGQGAYLDAKQQRFLRQVDAALAAVAASDGPAPIVLVGTDRMRAHFRHITSHTGLLAGEVAGSHGQTDTPRLAGIIEPAALELVDARADEAVERALRRADQARVAVDLAACWRHTHTGRGSFLVVADDYRQPAVVSEDGLTLEFRGQADPTDPEVLKDAIDELVAAVLRFGGEVAVIPADRFPHLPSPGGPDEPAPTRPRMLLTLRW